MKERQNTLALSIDGKPYRVPVGISVAAALSLCGGIIAGCRFHASRAHHFAAWAFVRNAG